MRDAEPEANNTHQPNHILINPIFQLSNDSLISDVEMNHTDMLLTPGNHFVEGDIEMSDRAIESHDFGDFVVGIHGKTANM
ncbi:hypothetical protein MKX01_010955, partial [Papaver californicum]